MPASTVAAAGRRAARRAASFPGLANAHSHAFQRALRGRTERDRADRSGPGASRCTRSRLRSIPTRCCALARATFAEMALAGVTLVGEFHYVHHAPGGAQYADPNAMGEAVIEAARGGRGAADAARHVLPARRGRAPTRCRAAGSATRTREAWARASSSCPTAADARIGAAIHSMRAVEPESAAAVVAAWAAPRALPLHAHVSEQPAENEACLEVYGATPVALLASRGRAAPSASPRSTPPMCPRRTWRCSAAPGARCCLCPTTERDLADGIGPARALARRRLCGSRSAATRTR